MKEILYMFAFLFGWMAYTVVLILLEVPMLDIIFSLPLILRALSMLGIMFLDMILLFFPFYFGFEWVERRIDEGSI